MKIKDIIHESTEYRGLHTAPTPDSGAPLHDLTGIYPDDIYGPKAAQFYGHFGGNDPMDVETIRKIHLMRGKPRQAIQIYRAVPKNIKDINAGDWVTINKRYAQDHGESALGGDYRIISKIVNVGDLYTNGDSIHEYGYYPNVGEGWRDLAAAGSLALGLAGGSQIPDTLKKQPQPEPVVQKAEIQTNNPLERILIDTARKAGIDGVELAQLLAQAAHETWDFTKMVEQGSKKYFSKYDIKYAPKTAKILGNTKPGDGERYKGRGFVQLTGKYNYQKAGEVLGLPLLEKPELAGNPEVAAKIALWYWQNRVKRNTQNFGDTKAVTKFINPALKGLQDRHENFIGYKQELNI
jgi:putative chitinase